MEERYNFGAWERGLKWAEQASKQHHGIRGRVHWDDQEGRALAIMILRMAMRGTKDILTTTKRFESTNEYFRLCF